MNAVALAQIICGTKGCPIPRAACLTCTIPPCDECIYNKGTRCLHREKVKCKSCTRNHDRGVPDLHGMLCWQCYCGIKNAYEAKIDYSVCLLPGG